MTKFMFGEIEAAIETYLQMSSAKLKPIFPRGLDKERTVWKRRIFSYIQYLVGDISEL